MIKARGLGFINALFACIMMLKKTQVGIKKNSGVTIAFENYCVTEILHFSIFHYQPQMKKAL